MPNRIPVYEYIVYYRSCNTRKFHDRNKAVISAGDYWSMHDQREPVSVYRRPAGSADRGVLIWQDGQIMGT